ncbi:hypothetical protein ACIRPX_28160 [Streptomyces sp. NPDC101225]|uniref:hypothetical protein n=1 Tax=Streptomyces sp. NPDC101225 TaxID=3366135 RepID=UPI0037F8BC59
MTAETPGNDHLPVYESLLRERGDVVAEARVAAAQMQYQAPQPAVHHDPVAPGPRHDQQAAGPQRSPRR